MATRQRILFLCKGNAARSQMAEAVMRHIGGEYFHAFSAGTGPKFAIHPQALETLSRNRIPVDGLTPKDVSTFGGQPFDYVVCLCDRDREDPIELPGVDVMHWRFPDPAASAEGPERIRAFEDVLHALERRIRLLIAVTTPRRSLMPTAA
jgi:ArsR family transcriptional regulator, arsenate/arsenite/antimonite-responsive transcriptional repressor / arsenate reductase (thioredoxin)